MLGRKAPRRTRHRRDRGLPQNPPPRAAPRSAAALAPPHDPNRPPVTFVWPDASRAQRHVVLVASFDGWLHHRMTPPTPLPPSRPVPDAVCIAAAFFTLTLNVPPGRHTYKFLVDGVWRTDSSSAHPIHLTPDGVKHHTLFVAPPSITTQAAPPDRLGPQVTKARLAEMDARTCTAVFRSASSSAVPSMRPPGAASSSTSLHEAPRSRRKVDIAPRGSSFNAPPQLGTYSQTQTANRKSLLQRVGYGWMKRFSSRQEDCDRVAAAPDDLVGTGHADRSAASLFRSGKDRVSLFPSSSDPNVGNGRDAEKENSMKNWSTPGTPDHGASRRGGGALRGSARNSAVTVSRPMKVDEPRDVDEVNRQADNWRQMAKHLQDNLSDPTGARELFSRAIQHREKHGLWCSSQNAQVHVDLARNMSKAEHMKDAEFHLRIALRIYAHIEAGQEHIADLLLYVGVVVDRQKRREEAEDLYRQALAIYKEHNITGNNLEIAVKNLSLNLRKQNRDYEIEGIRREFGLIQSTSVIV